MKEDFSGILEMIGSKDRAQNRGGGELWYFPSWIAAGEDRMGTQASWEA